MKRCLHSSRKGMSLSFSVSLKDVRFVTVAENLRQGYVPGMFSMP